VATEAAPEGRLRRGVVLNTLTNYANKILTLGVWFFLTPFLVRKLGDSEYGLWILVGSVVAYGTLLDLGIAPAVTKYVAEYRARGQVDQARGLVATALWLYTGLGLLAFLLSLILAPLFPHLFAVPADQATTAVWLVVLSGLGLAVALPSVTASAVLQGLQRFDLSNLIGVVGMTLFTVATVSVLLLGGGLLGMVAVNIPLTLIMQVPAIWLIHRTAPELRFGWSGARRDLARRVFSFSSALVVVNVAGQVQTQTDEIVIGAFLPVANVTPYSIARRLSAIPQLLTNQFVKVLMPLASHLNATDERRQLQALYLISMRLTLAIEVPLVCGLLVLARAFLAVWVGPEFAGVAPLAAILAIASLFDTSMWPAAYILQGMARHRPLAIIAIGSAAVNLALSVWLVHPLGLTGVALGTLVPTTIECVALVTPYAMRQNGVSLRAFLVEILWPTLLPAVPMLGVLVALRQWLQPASYFTIGVVGLAGAAVYGLLYLALSRGKPEQALLRQSIADVLAAVRGRADAKPQEAQIADK
jgi:O-antigen/teichoic acid export membrane protein